MTESRPFRPGDSSLIWGEAILPLLPAFHLSEITEGLFGTGVVSYDLPFAAIHAKHLAIE